MKVYGYVRCSTDKQDLQRQMLLIRRHCEQNHYELIDFIGEKVSGAKENRSGLNDVFNLSKDECDIVIISDLSRLSREDDILNVMSEVNAIRRNGMDLYILDTDTWIRKSDTVDGMQVMKLVFTAVGNADERRKIAERMKTGRYAKLVKNHYAYIGGQVPFGFKVVPNPLYDEKSQFDREPRTILVPDDENVRILKMMYTKIANGYTLHRLSKFMIDNNMIISGGNIVNYQTLISDIIHNELYIGKRKYNGIEVDIEPLVDVDLYNRAMDALTKNRWVVSYSTNFNPLKGLLYCTCGRSLYYTNCKDYKYYKCYKKKDEAENQICSNMGLKAETAFKAIWMASKNILMNSDFKLQTSEKLMQLKRESDSIYDILGQCELDLIRKRKEKEKLVNQISSLSNENLIKALEEKYNAIENEIEEISAKRANCSVTINGILRQLRELQNIDKNKAMESASLLYKSEMLHKIISRCVWCSDRLRKGFLLINYINGASVTLYIQTSKMHSMILQFPESMQLDVSNRVLRDGDNVYMVDDIVKLKYDKWVIEETIISKPVVMK